MAGSDIAGHECYLVVKQDGTQLTWPAGEISMTFAHLTMATRDVAATVAFLTKTLGWKSLTRPGNIDMKGAWLQIGPDQEIHLLEIADFEASAHEAEFGRHVAIFHAGADFPQLKQRLAKNGAELIDPQRETPFERFFFRDPNGYIFEVIDEQGYLACAN